MIIISDLDGTLARCDDRIQFICNPETGQPLARVFRDWPSFHEAGARALPYKNVAAVLYGLQCQGHQVHIITGRPTLYREATIHWLYQNHIGWDSLQMRGADDFRSDIEYKGEIFQRYYPLDSVLCILEDRDRMVRMARDMGYTCFQVNRGAF